MPKLFTALAAFLSLALPAMSLAQRPAFPKDPKKEEVLKGKDAKSRPALRLPFRDLDVDRDGQLTLVEWRRGGLDVAGFADYDRNEDGLITEEEALGRVRGEPDLNLEKGVVLFTGMVEETKDNYRGKKSFKLLNIRLQQGQTYVIEHHSKEFQAFLYLENSDGNVVAENSSPNIGGLARLLFQAQESGGYRLVVTSLGGFRTGPFSLSVRLESRVGGALAVSLPAWFKQLDKDRDGQLTLKEWRDGGKDVEEFPAYDRNEDGLIPAEEILGRSRAPLHLNVEAGEASYSGALEEAADGDYRGKPYIKILTIKLNAGEIYQFDHRSKDFDAFLYLEDADGELLAQNDDGGEGLNSRIVYRATSGGLYRLIATSLGARSGTFTLAVRVTGLAAKGLPSWFKGLDTDRDGQVSLREWRNAGKKPEDFADYDRNDDGVSTVDEVLAHMRKQFDLRFVDGLATYTGAVEETPDEIYHGKKSYKVLTVKLRQGETYQVEAHSKEFQAFLYLEDMEGNVLMQHSSPNIGGVSRLLFQAEHGGIYRLVATSLGGFRTGPFTLSVRVEGRFPAKGMPSWFKDVDKDRDGQISLLEWRGSGKITSDFVEYDRNDDGLTTSEEVLALLRTHVDLKLDRGLGTYNGAIQETAYENYRGKKSFTIVTVRLEEGSTYLIELRSKVFQSFLYVEDADGNVLMQNSSPTVGGVARIFFNPEESGVYRLVITSLGGFRTGPYDLAIRHESRLAGITPDIVPAQFKELDTDHDGQVALAEWRAGGMRLEEFAEYDGNEDGLITLEEVLSVFRKNLDKR